MSVATSTTRVLAEEIQVPRPRRLVLGALLGSAYPVAAVGVAWSFWGTDWAFVTILLGLGLLLYVPLATLELVRTARGQTVRVYVDRLEVWTGKRTLVVPYHTTARWERIRSLRPTPYLTRPNEKGQRRLTIGGVHLMDRAGIGTCIVMDRPRETPVAVAFSGPLPAPWPARPDVF